MLPDLPDVGVWRLESHGWNAAAELPGTVEVIRAAAERGQFLEGRLRIEERSQVKQGKTSRFIVPVLDLDVTMRQLVSGGPRASLDTGVGQAALPAPDIDTKALARDLLTRDGVLLLATDYLLDANLIRQIRDYAAAEGGAMTVFIRNGR